MTDYVDAMAARALGRVSPIRPVLPPSTLLDARMAFAAGPEVTPLEAEATESLEPRPEPAVPAPAARPGRSPIDGTPADRSRVARTPDSIPEPPPISAATGQTARERPGATAAPASSDAGPLEPGRMTGTPLDGEAPAATSATTTDAPPGPAPTALSRSELADDAPAWRPDRERIARPPDVPLGESDVSEAGSRRAAVDVEVRRSPTGTPPARAAWPKDEDRDGEPTVHVTIGRLEVRAASSTPAPLRVPSQPLAPRLTLDEYLRRRDEAGRR